jgi:hypothetical protein
VSRALVTLAMLAVFALGSSSTFAGSPKQPLDLATANGFRQFSSWIEQQDDWPMPASPIINPDPACTWSVNDHNDWLAIGSIEAGASTVRSQCIVSDFSPVYATRNGMTAWWSNAVYGFAGLSVRSMSPDLSVSVCYQPQGRCFVPSPVYDAADRVWLYRFCGRAHYDVEDPGLVDVAGSNGGRGIVGIVTMTVANPTSRRVRDVWAAGGLSSDAFYPSACDRDAIGRPIVPNVDYPFKWAT